MAYQNNATQMVYDAICDNIKKKKWLQGDKIWTEQELSKQLNVSRIAVRQAIDKLVAISVLRKVQGSGTYVEKHDAVSFFTSPVYSMSVEDLLQLILFRMNFESGNVSFFVENAKDSDIAELEQNYKKMCAAQDDREEFALCDFEFHQIIANGTLNSFIIQINNFMSDMLREHQHFLNRLIGPEIGIEYHGLILKYIKERDTEVSSLLMKKHISVTAERIREYIKAETNRLE